MIAQCAAHALALAVGGALRPPYPLIPPALNRCDEAAEAQTMLYSSYGQKGLQWIYGQPFRLPTYPMRPPHLPTAAICDLNDSPPNSLLKINP